MNPAKALFRLLNCKIKVYSYILVGRPRKPCCRALLDDPSALQVDVVVESNPKYCGNPTGSGPAAASTTDVGPGTPHYITSTPGKRREGQRRQPHI